MQAFQSDCRPPPSSSLSLVVGRDGCKNVPMQMVAVQAAATSLLPG
jgi:hypothetical protein